MRQSARGGRGSHPEHERGETRESCGDRSAVGDLIDRTELPILIEVEEDSRRRAVKARPVGGVVGEISEGGRRVEDGGWLAEQVSRAIDSGSAPGELSNSRKWHPRESSHEPLSRQLGS